MDDATNLQKCELSFSDLVMNTPRGFSECRVRYSWHSSKSLATLKALVSFLKWLSSVSMREWLVPDCQRRSSWESNFLILESLVDSGAHQSLKESFPQRTE